MGLFKLIAYNVIASKVKSDTSFCTIVIAGIAGNKNCTLRPTIKPLTGLAGKGKRFSMNHENTISWYCR